MIKKISLCILFIHINLILIATCNASYRIATVLPFEGISIEEKYKDYLMDVPKILEERLTEKASKQLLFLERVQYNYVLEEFEFENKRKENFDKQSMISRLKSSGADCVLIGSIEQHAESGEIIITAKIVLLETAQKLAHRSHPIKYSILSKGRAALVCEINKIAEELNIRMTEFYTEESIKLNKEENDTKNIQKNHESDNKDKYLTSNKEENKSEYDKIESLFNELKRYRKFLDIEKSDGDTREVNSELISVVSNIIKLLSIQKLNQADNTIRSEISKKIDQFSEELNNRKEKQEYFKKNEEYKKIRNEHR